MSWDELFAWPAGPRFVVETVTGFRINPSSGFTTSKNRIRTVPVSAYVLDRAYAHRRIAEFERKSRYTADVVASAEAYAAELNAWDAAT